MTLVRRVGSDDDRKAAFAIRHEVFVVEQGVPVQLELDEQDASAVHVLALGEDGSAVGTGRYYVEDGAVAHVGRLAVLAPARGTGVGKRLVAALEDAARAAGLREARLGAQVHAVSFYEALGYVPEGDVFDDAGIDHRWMRSAL